MQVSFVIPLYNCLRLTQAMLASLQATVPAGLRHEIIFVDDGSRDGTREWLGSLSAADGYKVHLNAENAGYAASNNRGAALAGGDYLVLLNNDLVLTPGWLEPMLALHRRLARPGVVGNVQVSASSGELDHTGIVINAKGKPEHDRRLPAGGSRSRRVDAVTGACWLVRRDLWTQLGGFDEGFLNGCEDVDFCLRAASHRHVNAVALESVIRHHVSASPGRKLRDEANTRRLVLRWRDELALRGSRAWSQDYVARILNAATAFSSPLGAWRVLCHALGLRRSPPPEALSGIHHAIDRELARWESLLGQA